MTRPDDNVSNSEHSAHLAPLNSDSCQQRMSDRIPSILPVHIYSPLTPHVAGRPWDLFWGSLRVYWVPQMLLPVSGTACGATM